MSKEQEDFGYKLFRAFKAAYEYEEFVIREEVGRIEESRRKRLQGRRVDEALPSIYIRG